MHFSTLLASVSLAASTLAAPAPSPKILHESRPTSAQWKKLGRVHPDVKLPVRIGLTQSNLDKGHEMLMNVAHPESENYGSHWTAEQVHDFFSPADDTVKAVREWLESAGIEAERISHSVNKQWLQFDAKSSEVEDLVNAKYHFFEHGPSGKNSIACDEYHLPESIKDHVDYITPGIKLYATNAQKHDAEDIEKRSLDERSWPHHPPHRPRPWPPAMPMPVSPGSIMGNPSLETCNTAITPKCIRAMYNITFGTKAFGSNQLGIFEDLGDVYAQQDLNSFFANVSHEGPFIPQGTHPKLEAIDGAVAPVTNISDAGLESSLDLQISYPIIWPQNSVLFQTDDPVYEANYTYDGFLNNFLDAIDGSYCTYSAYGETGNSPLDPVYPDPQPGGYKGNLQCGVYKPTNVISISYGGQEDDLPASYQQRQCNEWMKLGLQGVSIVVSSGDSGVAARGSDSPNGCLSVNGSTTTNGTIFNPGFPATCPYLLTVGGTYLPPGASAAKDEEIAVTRFPSGGGFSNIYPIPEYQKAAVQKYFTAHNPPYPYYYSVNNASFGANGGIYNRAGRGYPDVSAIGDRVMIFGQGRGLLIGGTSASAPTFAAILTRINEERIAVGKSTVGFVNPTLYAHPEVLHDITNGTNPGCGTSGFSAATGWDPVTGLGTPNYREMLKLFMKMR